MYFKYSLIVLICLSFFSATSQNSFWSKINVENERIESKQKIEYDISVKKASYFQLNKSELLNHIQQAPFRDETNYSSIMLEIPDQDGVMENYKIYKVKTLAPELAQNYPDIHSFVGERVDVRDGSRLRITVTPFGFYAMISKPKIGQLFINPLTTGGDFYSVFLKSNAIDLNKPECFFENISENIDDDSISFGKQLLVDDSNLRIYRLAVAATGEYSQFHISQAGLSGGTTSQQILAVLSAITVTIDRVNSIYERDLGSTLQLIPNNDQIIFLDGFTDPYTNNDVFAMLSENQSTLDAIIQSANYDIGHIVSTAPGGGVAVLGGLCSSNAKAQGATGGIAPVGDPFDVDYVSHEIGHQFGATHTFNNFCGGARSSQTAMEPGSGNTIMAYAGICPPNVQLNSDAHFHQVSISQIFQNISNNLGSVCANLNGQPNSAPVVTPLPNYIIPHSTAFFLDVEAVDAENDPLTYNWEQVDNEISFPNNQEQPPVSTSMQGPNFRSLPSTTESRRYFPNFSDVLAGNLAPTWEVVPTVSRDMEFVVTVRDNNLNVGQSSLELVDVNYANVGPFQVTSQNTFNINWLPGETRTITWDVAGTDANGINTSNVNILLSTDDGQTFSTTLASNTPNDGSEDIVVPSLSAPFCRVLIEPVDNIYYAVNPTSFSIDTNVSVNCENFLNSNAVAIPDGGGTSDDPEQGPIASSSINIPSTITNIEDINVTLDVSHTYINDLVFQLQAPNNDIIVLWGRNCNSEDSFNITFNDNGNQLPSAGSNCSNPLTGTFAPASTSTDLATIFSNGTSGDWTLQFADFFPQDTGTLNSWEIEICSTVFSVADNQINNFSISPNPNRGVFDLNLSQPLGEEGVISIYDIRGRLIENIIPESNSLTLTIELQKQYKQGIYLIEVKNLNGKFVSKLIIK